MAWKFTSSSRKRNMENLLTENIDLSGRKIMVSEATYLMGIERGRIIGLMTAATAESPNEIQSSVLINVYSGLAACSTGDVPTADDFLQMRDSDVQKWIDAARRLNGHWFEWMGEAEEALTDVTKTINDKKKGKKTRKR